MILTNDSQDTNAQNYRIDSQTPKIVKAFNILWLQNTRNVITLSPKSNLVITCTAEHTVLVIHSGTH